MKNKRSIEDWEIQFLRDNYNSLTISDICLVLNRTKNAIHKIAMRNNIHRPSRTNISGRKYKFDTNYFKVPTIENSYFAGFIAGDGHITNNGYGIEISIANIDEIILYKFVECLKSNHPISIAKRSVNDNVNSIDRSRIRISSYELVNDLNNVFNITNNKSFILNGPNISLEYSLSYLIGLIDADGCITYTKEGYLLIDITGTESILLWINNLLGKNYNLYTSINKCSKTNKVKHMRYFGRKAYQLYKILINISTPIKLSRKWDKVKGYKING